MKSAAKVAAIAISEPVLGCVQFHTKLEDELDHVWMAPHDSMAEATATTVDARGIIERIVTRGRAPLVAALQEALDDYRCEIERMAQIRQLGGPKEDHIRGFITKLEAVLKEGA